MARPNFLLAEGAKGAKGLCPPKSQPLPIKKAVWEKPPSVPLCFPPPPAGARVLGVDLDPQGSLGFSLGLDIEHCATVYDIFRGAAQPEEVIRQTDTCDILPSNILLSAAELEFNKPGREFLLKGALSKIQDQYDYYYH